MGINENCKYFIVALIETISFNFRLDIGPTNLNDMDEFVPVTKHMNSTESKIQIHLVKKIKKRKDSQLFAKACVRYFLSIFIFHQMITLHELWKMFFISSRKALFVLEIFKFLWFFTFLYKLSTFRRAIRSGIIYDVMSWLA